MVITSTQLGVTAGRHDQNQHQISIMPTLGNSARVPMMSSVSPMWAVIPIPKVHIQRLIRAEMFGSGLMPSMLNPLLLALSEVDRIGHQPTGHLYRKKSVMRKAEIPRHTNVVFASLAGRPSPLAQVWRSRVAHTASTIRYPSRLAGINLLMFLMTMA